MLLKNAQCIYDDPTNGLKQLSRSCWKQPFQSGAGWMQEGLTLLRVDTSAMSLHNYSRLGVIKYGLCSVVLILFVILSIATHQSVWIVVGLLGFYAVEAQMVFLFPLALDGSHHPFRDSFQWTQKAGGTHSVMITVIAIALSMVFGGFVGRGFLRSWCLGCLAILVWYELLK